MLLGVLAPGSFVCCGVIAGRAGDEVPTKCRSGASGVGVGRAWAVFRACQGRSPFMSDVRVLRLRSAGGARWRGLRYWIKSGPGLTEDAVIEILQSLTLADVGAEVVGRER